MARLRKEKSSSFKKGAAGGGQKSIQGADKSGSDVKSEKKLKADLTKFMKGLDITNHTETSLTKSAKPKREDRGRGIPRRLSQHASKARESPKKGQELKAISHVSPTLAPPRLPMSPITQKSAVRPISSTHPRPSATPLLPSSPEWYNLVPPLSTTQPSKTPPVVTPALLSEMQERGSALLASAQSSAHSSSTSTSQSEDAFFRNIIASGTLSDRLSALTLLVQGSPLHHIKALETLQNMAGKRGASAGAGGSIGGGREVGLKALRCISDWWVGGGAPERKLKYLRDQPLTHPGVTDKHILIWYFEDWLKKWFFGVLQILENLTSDPLPYVRTQALNLIYALLKDRPEQEQNLLRLLAWKLGDPQKPICARASYLLLSLLQAHPAMKGVIVRELSGLILHGNPSHTSTSRSNALEQKPKKKRRFRDTKFSAAPAAPAAPTKPKAMNTNAHFTYYAMITLNQIVLSKANADVNVARDMVRLYFEVFKDTLGVASAGGRSPSEQPVDEDAEDNQSINKGDERRKSKKGKGTERLKPSKGDAPFAELEDSNSKLVSAVLTGLHRALPFTGIENDDQLSKYIDTLFLITHKSTFNISLQALVLLQHISTSLAAARTEGNVPAPIHPLTERYYLALYASLHDPRLATSSKQAMFLNLLFKSIKADTVLERQMAFVKRFVQVLVWGGAGSGGAAVEWVVGGLYLLGELLSGIAGLRSLLSSRDHNNESVEQYDPLKRSPRYAQASSSGLRELFPLAKHYHPTVSLYAKHLVAGELLPAGASPNLTLNTLTSFLDRFVFRNPKKRAHPSGELGDTATAHTAGKGGSLMQPAASAVDGVKLVRGGKEEVRLNDETWWKRNVEDVSVDQVFFHKYFTMKHGQDKRPAKREQASNDSDSTSGQRDGVGEGGDAESGIEEVEEGEHDSNDDEGSMSEDDIWRAMKRTMPKITDGDESMEHSDGPSDSEDIGGEGSDSDHVDEQDDESQRSGEMDDQTDEQISVDGKELEGQSDEDGLSLAEGSDCEDLIPLEGLIEYDGSGISDSPGEGEDATWDGIGQGGGRKRKHEESGSGKKKRRKVLPTFASYEDYAKLIEEGPEDDI